MPNQPAGKKILIRIRKSASAYLFTQELKLENTVKMV